MQPTVFDFQNPSSAAKRRQLTCPDDDLAILSAFVRGEPGLQLGKLPPHSRLSIAVLRDTVGFTFSLGTFLKQFVVLTARTFSSVEITIANDGKI